MGGLQDYFGVDADFFADAAGRISPDELGKFASLTLRMPMFDNCIC
jgi:hypothetical protein